MFQTERGCNQDHECGADECCVSVVSPRGKRAADDTLITSKPAGVCKRQGDEGSSKKLLRNS